MLFSSSIFIFLFLPVSLIGYQILSRFGRTALLSWLSLASLFFYGYWNPAYLILLCASIVMNYLFSQALGGELSEEAQSRWLLAGIVSNLALLMYFKYFFPVLNFFHAHGVLPHAFEDVILPLGISFFTFTQIAYLIDLREKIAKRQGLISYSVFVTFFPHLIAGPIIHPRELMPQLEDGRIHSLRANDLAVGMTWFVMGLAKKVLIADRVAPLADILYAHPHSAGFATSWLGALAYTLQLYFDFSGYSDMALALARMFGLEFPFNFNSPHKAQGIIEFWTRWHMTLSRYLNEYLYTPISRWVFRKRLAAGKRNNRAFAATPKGYLQLVFFPTMTTMFIAGIWHGASITFLIFGVLHGVFLCVNYAWRLLTPEGTKLYNVIPRPLLVLLTFLCMMSSEVFFRAASVRDALYVLGTMCGLHHGPAFAAFPYLDELPSIARYFTSLHATLALFAVCLFILWAMPNTQEILNQHSKVEARAPSLFRRLLWKPNAVWSLGLATLFCLVILMLDASTRFLYFQF